MAVTTPTKGTEMAFIDCKMIVVTTEEDSPRSVSITSGAKLGVEALLDTVEAVKLNIKGVLKAQKKESKIITGHTLTLTDNMTILELMEIVQGGTLTRDPESHEITGYEPPVVGEAYKPVKFKLEAYSAQMDEGGNEIGYEKVTYPGCTGQPVGLNSEDNVFRVTEYTITSAPSKGEAPYKWEYVKALPEVQEPTEVGA